MRYIIFTFLSFILFTSVHFTLQKGASSLPNDTIAGMAEQSGMISADSTVQREITMQVDHPAVTAKFEAQGNNPERRRSIDANEFVNYAKGLIGTPYVYGSSDPGIGFDCSGFINHISGHFGIKVPRSSVEFTNLGSEISTVDARPGDIILFTGTNPHTRIVGHMGVVTDNPNGQIEFIHSSSGKAKGVVISELKGYYETRFVKVIRFFPLTYVNSIA